METNCFRDDNLSDLPPENLSIRNVRAIELLPEMLKPEGKQARLKGLTTEYFPGFLSGAHLSPPDLAVHDILPSCY
jgi:hypothetical protein